MSKISAGVMMKALADILEGSKQQKGGKSVDRRKFKESVDLLVNLKNYDAQRDKRFSGSVRLPRIARPRFRVAIIGDAVHAEQAAKAGIPSLSTDDLKKLNKEKKQVKRLCSKYDAFLASDTLIKTIPKLVGPFLSRAGKFPSSAAHTDNLTAKVEELRATVKFQLKKVLCLGACIGHTEMSADDLRLNLTLAVNYLVSLLKKGWQNLKSVYVKSSMGKPHRVF